MFSTMLWEYTLKELTSWLGMQIPIQGSTLQNSRRSIRKSKCYRNCRPVEILFGRFGKQHLCIYVDTWEVFCFLFPELDILFAT